MEAFRICSGVSCKGALRPIADFYVVQTGPRKGRFRSPCKTCLKVRQEAWNQNNEKRRIAKNKQYRIENKDKIAETTRAWRARNLEKVRSYQRLWARRNPEIKYKNLKKWKKENPFKPGEYYRKRERLIRAAGGGIFDSTRSDYAARISYYGGLCAYCRGPYETLDHVKSISRGGTNHPCNIVPACESCNKSKGSRLPSEWVDRIDIWRRQQKK